MPPIILYCLNQLKKEDWDWYEVEPRGKSIGLKRKEPTLAHVSHKLSNSFEGALAGGGDPATSPLYVFGPFINLAGYSYHCRCICNVPACNALGDRWERRQWFK